MVFLWAGCSWWSILGADHTCSTGSMPCNAFRLVVAPTIKWKVLPLGSASTLEAGVHCYARQELNCHGQWKAVTAHMLDIVTCLPFLQAVQITASYHTVFEHGCSPCMAYVLLGLYAKMLRLGGQDTTYLAEVWLAVALLATKRLQQKGTSSSHASLHPA